MDEKSDFWVGLVLFLVAGGGIMALWVYVIAKP